MKCWPDVCAFLTFRGRSAGSGKMCGASREQRRIALTGYAAGACVEAIGVAGLYWLMVMYR